MKKVLGLLLVTLLWVGCSKDDEDPTYSYSVDWEQEIEFNLGETQTFTATEGGEYVYSISQPEGWTVTREAGKLIVTAPTATTASAEYSGQIKVVVGTGRNVVIVQTNVFAVATLTFEEVPESYLAGPTSAGENIHQYTGYADVATGLKWESSSTEYDDVFYWSQGLAVSQWTNREGADFNNQCSVYAAGGNNGSKTFGVNFSGSPISLSSVGTECVVEEIWVMNSTYTALTMKNGNAFSKAFSYDDKDWFLLTVTGYDKVDAETGTVEFYLADFRKEDAPGILEEWSRVDLSSLGKVHKLGFTLSSSDEGEWGMNTPNYFCIDDIKIRK